MQPINILVSGIGAEIAAVFADRFGTVGSQTEFPGVSICLAGEQARAVAVTVLKLQDLAGGWAAATESLTPGAFERHYVVIAAEVAEMSEMGVDLTPIYKERNFSVVFAGNPRGAGRWTVGLIEKAARALFANPTKGTP
jgi:hypothetical protein